MPISTTNSIGYRLRQAVRHIALDGLSAYDHFKQREERLADKQMVQVVMFHHVYDHEEQAFGEFLKWFGSHYRVIRYGDAVDRIERGDIDGPYGAITFDDGLKSIVPAARIMSEMGMSGCFFVCPGIIGETDPVRLRQFCEATRMDYESDEFAGWDELAEMKAAGHEIGSHTINHPELHQCTTSQIGEELQRSREILSERLGAIEHFAWPYGGYQYLGEPAASTLKSVGYRSSASGHRGAHGAHTNNQSRLTCVRRDNLEANWPLRHIRHFLLSNADNPVGPEQWWPEGWQMTTTSSSVR